MLPQSSHALQPLTITGDTEAVDVGPALERVEGTEDRAQVSTVPGQDGMVRRLDVRSASPGSHPSWATFAVTNSGDEQIDRLLVVPHYRLVGSGVLQPDLGATRILALTASQGIAPERQPASDADIYLLTLDPGATVTYVAELAAPNLPQIALWDPNAYKDQVNSFTLYRGMVLGISGLLALILTILFVVKGSMMFPAAAALAWAVLAYLGIDFGFWRKILLISTDDEQVWRAAAEALLAATLLIFLFAYLNLNRWHVRYGHVIGAWLLVLAVIAGTALFDPTLAAAVARISLALVALFGFGVVCWLATQGYDRAVMLVPTCLLLLLWVVAAGFAVTGLLANDLVQPALVGGLVLIVLLIGFTVMQHAFAGGAVAQGMVSDIERKALALAGSGDIVWDWDSEADHIFVSPEMEQSLGMRRGALAGPAARWLDVLHPNDRDRFRASLDALVAERQGRLFETFRLRGGDGRYVWFTLRARPVIGSDGEVLRCVGTMLDVTEAKTTEERLLHNAVHDNLTGLPNRELFNDRLEAALGFAARDPSLRPTVLLLDIDRFKKINEAVGVSTGDTILITIVRRLSRLLKPQDTLARLGGDQFGIIFVSETASDRITQLADNVRKALRSPVSLGGREVFVTASIGLALHDPQTVGSHEDLVKNAETAMHHSKRFGGDHTEVFKVSMRTVQTERLTMESELGQALQRGEMKVLFQPIVRLENHSVVGFEAVLRWEHARYGRRSPAEFLAVAEENGTIVDLGLFALEGASRQLASWQGAAADGPLFVSVNVSNRQFLRQDLVQDVRNVLARFAVPRSLLKIELSESAMMANPEHSAQMLLRMRELGVGLVLDEFGTGQSSLSYLQRFPFDLIKLDRSIVRGDRRGGRPVILRSIISLATDLGVEVIADGTESEADAVDLFHLGCHYAQGLAFGDPVAGEQATKMLGITTRPVSSATRRLFEGLRVGAGR